MNWGLIGFAIIWIFGTMFGMSMEGNTGVASSDLASRISATATTVTVASTRDFPDAGYIVIDDEFIEYTGTTSTTFTGLTRGSRDTEAASHTSGRTVYSEISGLVNLGLDFTGVTSSAPVVGPVVTLANGGFLILKFIGKIIIWDWPYWDYTLLGFPLYIIQVLMSILSIGFLVVILRDLKQIANPFG